MATEVKRRRGSDLDHQGFTGAVAELTVNTDDWTVHVHDGTNNYGYPLLRQDFDNVPTTAPFTHITLDTAIFDTAYTETESETQGTLYWNQDEETLSLVTNGETIELGQKIEVHVKNQTGSQIDKGEVVYASGTLGASGRILVTKMIADGTIAAKRILGVAAENIANGADGKVVKFGKIRKVNTSAYSNGDILWVSTTAAGAFQNTEPVQADGEIALPIAYVVYSSSNNGEIFVRITPIDENEYQNYDAGLADIAGLTPTDGNFIVGNGSNFVAESGNTARTSLGLGTGDSPTFAGLTVNGNGLTANGAADLNSTLNVQGVLTTQDNILDDGFSEGWLGTNWRIKADGSAELEELRVRGALRVYEFIAKQISTIGGSEILSIANGRVESVDNVSSPKTITIDNVGSPATSFQAGDLWIIQEVDINSGSVTSVYGEVDVVVSGNVLQVTVTSGDLSQVEQGNIIVAYGHTDDSARQNVMYRNVDASEDNLIMRLQTGITEFSELQDEANTRVAFGDLGPKPGESIGYSGLDSETFGFFAGSNSGGHILATSSGLFLKDGSTTLAQLTSNTFKVGNGTKYVEFDGTDLDVQAEDFKLESGELVIDSSLDKKIVISNDDEEIIAIGDFVFGTEVEDTSTASASSSSTTATLTNAIPTNSDTNMDTGIGTLNSNVAQDSPIVTLSRTYNVTGKWVRVQFDYNAPPFDDSAFNEYAVGFSITYFGEQIQELNRNPEDSSAVSGSVDKTLFVPDTATFNTIQVQSLASSGGLSSSDEHSKINVSNLSVTVYDDTYSYTDIGNDGFRVYNSGGRKKIEFKDGNATATLDQLSIGSWDFQLASNGDLVLKYEGATVETFTKP